MKSEISYSLRPKRVSDLKPGQFPCLGKYKSTNKEEMVVLFENSNSGTVIYGGGLGFHSNVLKPEEFEICNETITLSNDK